MMTGLGVVRGMLVTLWHFILSYVEDVKRFPRRYRDDRASVNQGVESRGVFTVQYPEERLRMFERFRSFPVLIYETETGEERCTACGICAKVCPPQCIWIVRAKTPEGKPKPKPEEFVIDISICMSCGLCAEFCPFDSIKMDHKYELAGYERLSTYVLDKKALLVSSDYYAQTHPIAAAEEDEARRKKAEAKAGR
ncbi:MAG TPA: 4Fe-4S binding protein [Armatimonadota bacterium]|nr:4Fe-4S binding protein [Armatimonadota bacterium]